MKGLPTPKEVSDFTGDLFDLWEKAAGFYDKYEQMYLELVQLRAAVEILRTENEVLKEKLNIMEDLQIIIDNLIAQHGKDKVQAAVTNSSTEGDPVPPDPTHKP